MSTGGKPGKKPVDWGTGETAGQASDTTRRDPRDVTDRPASHCHGTSEATTGQFAAWFARVAAVREPYPWQLELGGESRCVDRLLRIPTGFGKTAGVVLAWLYHRVIRGDEAWPRRLVFCLPMRVLVEQTEQTIGAWIKGAGVDVDVNVLMGGVKAERWSLDIDRPAVLIGTQDMLLSRALNRGYAAARGMWPMEFGLLHQDALWVLDEVQLMDVGLATSAQLTAFREEDVRRGRARVRPVHTWWMSATLQPRWLATVNHPMPVEPPLHIPAEQRRGGLFGVQKQLLRAPACDDAESIAAEARARHVPGTLTLVIVNRVRIASEAYAALDAALSEGSGKKRRRRSDAPDLRLVHSRFRGVERLRWAKEFLHRGAPLPEAGRIIVATQVVEAGVDISATTLVTQLAPWSSLVQRFGRAARYEGESGTVVVVGAVPASDKDAAPYAARELAAADEAIARLSAREADASPRSVEAFEDDIGRSDPEFLARLYPYEPLHVLRRRDLDDLFDTTADLSGADIDVGRYIRSGEERDVSVFWRDIEHAATIEIEGAPRREELCPVPIGDLQEWTPKKLKAYAFDYLDGKWTQRDRFVPGMRLLLAAKDGGYSPERGWDLRVELVDPVPLAAEEAAEIALTSGSEDADDLSAAPWKTIATHGREAELEATAICKSVGLDETLARVVALAARWHDVGKAHRVFQDAIKAEARAAAAHGTRRDLAKAPKGAWHRPPYPERPGFRHELASTLALFELLRRVDPHHPALLGPHRELLALAGFAPDIPGVRIDHPLAGEIASLSAEDFDLLAWLVCTHHGKVRCTWTSTPRDQEKRHGGIHGVCEGDALPAFALTDAGGRTSEVPGVELSLSAAAMGVGARYGASWADRVARLVARQGPFTLTYLEAVLRVADVRASMLSTEDPLA